MDLRSFSSQNSGCIHEINTLLHVVPLEQIVLVVDMTTDLAFLEQTLQNAWRQHMMRAWDKTRTQEKIKVFKLDAADTGATTVMPWLCASAKQGSP